MGAVRSEKVKKVARELIRRYPDKFTTNFEENKKFIEPLINVPSKRLRNTIVGYVTRLATLSQSEKTPQGEGS